MSVKCSMKLSRETLGRSHFASPHLRAALELVTAKNSDLKHLLNRSDRLVHTWLVWGPAAEWLETVSVETNRVVLVPVDVGNMEDTTHWSSILQQWRTSE